MLIREAMAPDAEWITPDVLLTEAALRMRDKNIGCLPVGENDRLVGMITDRDLACRAVADGLNPQTTKARDVMTKGITWCFDDESVADAVQRMEHKQIHHMPVLDRQKRMVGILSLSDLALKGPQELFKDVSKLTSRDASRHASMPLTHELPSPRDAAVPGSGAAVSFASVRVAAPRSGLQRPPRAEPPGTRRRVPTIGP